MRLSPEQEQMISGKQGRARQKAMEILYAMGEARQAERMVDICYAHLMPPEVMFFPYGKQGLWDREMTEELTQGLSQFRVPTTIEPRFVDLHVARELGFDAATIAEIDSIMSQGALLYEKLGVVPTYSALPFYVFPTKQGQHVSIAESIAILWYNTIFGSRCERDDGITSLSAAITGCVPEVGMHLEENRRGEVLVRFKDDINFSNFTDADYDALSLAMSMQTHEKIPVVDGMPSWVGTNYTLLKHLLATIAVESGLPLMHIVGITPEAPTVEAAFGGVRPSSEVTIGKSDLEQVYQLACTASDPAVDYVLLGCPHLTVQELAELAEEMEGKKVSDNVRLIVSTSSFFKKVADDFGYIDVIRKAGAHIAIDMCIAFAGTQTSGTIATNTLKGAFFYSGFSSDNKRKVWFGSTRACARAALTGNWSSGR